MNKYYYYYYSPMYSLLHCVTSLTIIVIDIYIYVIYYTLYIPGHPTMEMIRQCLPPPSTDHLVYVCGPPPMVRAICGEKHSIKSINPAGEMVETSVQGDVTGALSSLGFHSSMVYKF